MSNFKDLTGKKFNRLSVIELDKEKSTSKIKYWVCKCDCDKIVSVAGKSLSSNGVKSCGCLNRELVAKRNSIIKSKSNRIEFDSGLNCYRGYFNNSSDNYFLFDINDLDIVDKYCFYINANGYIESTERGSKGKHVLLHRLIMAKYEDIDGKDIDHINHNTLDNRKFNLRVCDHNRNMTNRRPYSNTGEKYISYNKNKNNYLVSLPNNPVYPVDNMSDAIIYRNKYLKEHPDEFRYDPDEDYINRDNPNIIQPFIFIEK